MPRAENGDWYEQGWCPKCGMPETSDGQCLGSCSDDPSVEDDIDGNWDEDEDENEFLVDEKGLADEP